MSRRQNFHLRFRKSFPILGKFLQATISKRGLSLNLHLGPLSKSWGTGGRRSTTVDMPGTSGLFWQKRGSHQDDDDAVGEPGAGWRFLGKTVLVGVALVEAARLWVRVGRNCDPAGGLGWRYLTLTLAGLALLWFASSLSPRLRGVLYFLLALGIGYLSWKVYGGWISPSMRCR